MVQKKRMCMVRETKRLRKKGEQVYMSNKFTVIKGNAGTEDINRVMRTIAFCECWERQYHNTVNKVISANEGKQFADYPQEDLMKIALQGIKYVNSVREIRRENERVGTDYKQTLEEAQAVFQLMDAIFSVMGCIKLKNFVNIFPITKEYDGHKWECKDYFSTMNVLSKMDWDKPIGRDNIADLLWDYENDDLREVYVEFMCAMSALRRLQTGKGIVEQWCDDIGVPTYMFNQVAGVIKNNQTGQTTRFKKKSHIQIVK